MIHSEARGGGEIGDFTDSQPVRDDAHGRLSISHSTNGCRTPGSAAACNSSRHSVKSFVLVPDTMRAAVWGRSQRRGWSCKLTPVDGVGNVTGVVELGCADHHQLHVLGCCPPADASSCIGWDRSRLSLKRRDWGAGVPADDRGKRQAAPTTTYCDRQGTRSSHPVEDSDQLRGCGSHVGTTPYAAASAVRRISLAGRPVSMAVARTSSYSTLTLTTPPLFLAVLVAMRTPCTLTAL